jgi:hypothetical protein
MELANKYKMSFMEVSAKTGEKIEELFTLMGTKIIIDFLPNQEK